jgi:ubiquinone/menaquinone biosynthesis C-methylase UbiE
MNYKILKYDKEFVILDKGFAIPITIIHNSITYHHFRDGLYFSEPITDKGMANLFECLVREFDYESNYVTKEFNYLVYQRLLEFALKYLSNKDNSSILDFGCGTGLGFEVIKNYFPNSKLMGFDLSNLMVNISEKIGYIAIYEKQNKIDIPSDRIEFVIGVFVLGLIQSNSWIKEIYRVMNSSAIAVFNIYLPEIGWETKYNNWFVNEGFEILYNGIENFAISGINYDMPVYIVRK